jgi:hypothetical protein
MIAPSVASVTGCLRYCYLKPALMVGLISLNCKRVRLYQSEGKNAVNLSWTFQLLSTQRVESYDKPVKNNNPKGWRAEGIQRFNKLFDAVKKDRKTDEHRPRIG